MTDEQSKITGALESLLENAYRDTGGSRRAAQFLLSLWNVARYKVDLQELLYVESDQFVDMLTVLQEFYRLNAQLDTFVNEDQIKPIIEMWGETFEKK